MFKFIAMIAIFAFTSNIVLSNENTYYNDNYFQENQTYCAPKESFITKSKNSLFGQPTGYTPQIEPSPYLNSFGPSYMRGFYGRNGWADHNIYSPTVTGLGAHILD